MKTATKMIILFIVISIMMTAVSAERVKTDVVSHRMTHIQSDYVIPGAVQPTIIYSSPAGELYPGSYFIQVPDVPGGDNRYITFKALFNQFVSVKWTVDGETVKTSDNVIYSQLRVDRDAGKHIVTMNAVNEYGSISRSWIYD